MEDNDFDIGNLIAVLRRQARLIVITVIAVVGLTAVIVFTLTPIYQASAMVLVDVSTKNLLDPNNAAVGSVTDVSRLPTELEIMQSDATLLKVIEKENLVSDSEFGVKLGLTDRLMAFLQISQPSLPSGDAALRRVLEDLRKASSATQIGLSNLIAMSVRSESPERAAAIANSWSGAYVEMQVTAKIDSAVNARNILQSRLAQSRSTLVAAEESLDKYIDANLGAIVGDTGRADIQEVGSSLKQLIAQRNLDSTQVDQAEASLAQRNWSMLTNTLQSAALSELERQRQEVANALEGAAEGPAINLRAELADIETRLTDMASREVATLKQSVADSTSREADLRQRLRSAVLSSPLPASMLGDIFELQQGAELSRQQYQALLARTQDLDAQTGLQIADSRVISPALPPDTKAFPNIGLSLGAAAAIAFALGIAFALLRENLVGGLLTEDQAEAVLRVPVAAAAPRARSSDHRGDPGGPADLMISAPLSPFPEAIRRLKVAIDQHAGRLSAKSRADQGRQPGLVVMITSSTANEGKSSVALALARAFAVAHGRVAIIDCDFRKPSIRSMAGLDKSDDFHDLLDVDSRGAATFETVPVERDTLSSVTVLAGSSPSTLPTDHLISGHMFAGLIEQARKIHDIVILDTPPVGPVSDGLYIAAMADALVFVVRSGMTSQTEARLALKSLKTAAAPNCTIVAMLNQQDQASAQYKRRYGGYYSSEAS